MSIRTRVLGTALGCMAMLGSSAQASLETGFEAQSVDPPVFGGELSKACAWPTVVMVHMFMPEQPEGQQYGLCTGTLVHPRVVVFAAHCGDAIGVSVGLDRHAPNRIKEFEKVGRNPEWKNHPQYTKVDWGYAVLKEPLKGAATIPIAYGCELDMVQKKGQDVRLVGYSDNGKSGMDPDAFVQRWAKAQISQLGGGVLFATAPGVGVRSGDSGGPVLTQLKDGTWRTVGVVSRADGSSAAVSKEMIQWLNKETGIDVVPCFDDDGEPTEGKECDALRAFSGDPSDPKAEPDNNCIGAPSKWAGLACGLKKSDGSDPNDDGKGEDEEDDKKKGDEEEDDKKKGDEEEDDKKKGDEEDDKKKGDEEDEDKKKEDEEEDEDRKKGDKEDEDKKKDDEEDGKKKKGDDDEEKKGKDDGKGDKTKPAPSGGCIVAPGSSGPAWLFAGFVGLGLLRRRRSNG